MRLVTSNTVFALIAWSTVAAAQPAPASPASPPPQSITAFPEAGPPVERRIPDRRLVINNLLVLRNNPLGLEDQIRFGYQVRLVKSYDALFRDTFVFAGIAPKMNPAFVKIGPSLEVQPLSLLNLRGAIEFVDYFSTFGYLQSFASPLADYSDTRLQEGEDQKRNYATSGIHFMFEPTVQLKFGPVALRNKLAIEYWNVKLHGSDTVFYEATLDTLVPGNGWVLADDLDLLFLTKFGLTAGARYSTVHPFYRTSDYVAGADTAHNPCGATDPTCNPNSHHRLGALIAYTFFDRGYTSFNKPSLLAIVSWYLDHRYRAGADVSQAIPYLVIGFGFQSDLL
jgi:hypothetical protein